MIEVDSLTFAYPGAPAPTLQGLSFSIGRGEVFGLLGPSGAGKSTTQRILMGLTRGFSGKALVLGEPVQQAGRELYERIGVSFELPALYLRLTALENLKLFAALYETPTRDPMEVLSEVDLADAAGQRVDQFSKGMKMRLNLARALLHDPDLLFLDEPTTGQDPLRARATRDLMRSLKSRGKTIFLTTHNMAEAEEVCDRVAFLVDGRIPVTGTPEELKRRYGQRRVEVGLRDPSGVAYETFAMDGLGANDAFLALLRGDRVVSLHTKEASLDDIFIRTVKADGR
jgi:fluoroquinolone transport system ATP-binding protein